MISVTLVPARRLSPSHQQRWAEIQASESEIRSPFFCPEFTQAVAVVRNDLEVAVISTNGQVVGFFPFHRTKPDAALSVCGKLSEFQGVVIGRDVTWKPDDLLRACGLRTWPFDHLVGSPAAFAPYVWGHSDSPYADLSAGYEAYAKGDPSRKRSLAKARSRARQLDREIGPLRCEFHTPDTAVLDSLLAWKSAQYQRTGVLDYFHYEWVVETLRQLHGTSSENFSGVLSAAYAGDRLIAAHFGIRSQSVLHWWFPSYDRELAKYGPGWILFSEVAKACESQGIRRIDMGRGEDTWKLSSLSCSQPVMEGAVGLRPVARHMKHAWYATKRWMRSSCLSAVLEVPLRNSRRVRQWLTFR